MSVKSRPAEAQRQKRLVMLYDWGKTNIPPVEIFETIAYNRLMNRALEQFGCSWGTASNYTKIVLFRLRKETKPVTTTE